MWEARATGLEEVGGVRVAPDLQVAGKTHVLVRKDGYERLRLEARANPTVGTIQAIFRALEKLDVRS